MHYLSDMGLAGDTTGEPLCSGIGRGECEAFLEQLKGNNVEPNVEINAILMAAMGQDSGIPDSLGALADMGLSYATRS